MSRRALVLFVCMCVIWGIPYLFIRIAVTELPPVVLVFARTSIGAAILLPVAFGRGDVRPVLKLLTLPLNCLTFGLFSFVINAALFWAAGQFTGAYQVSFIGALVGSIVMAIINGIASHLLVPEGER